MSLQASIQFGFRRRCGWCGVTLRGWQLNLCRQCRQYSRGDAGIYLQSGGPPCSRASRWDADPDTWSRRSVAAGSSGEGQGSD